MNILFSFTLFTVVVTAVLADDWSNYKKKHGKNYSQAEEKVRAARFLQADAMIKKHNNENKHYQMEHNMFSDMSEAEKNDYMGAKLDPAAVRHMSERAELPLAAYRQIPASLDLRTHACMSAIRNQGSCGSCWAFAAIEPLEFSYCKAHGNVKVDLSEQQLVDCSTSNYGCNGGWYTSAWSYLYAGSAAETTYAYKALTSTCNMTSSTPVVAKVYGMYGYYRNNPAGMQSAIQTYGPLAVAIHVVSSFQYYKSGVYNDATCDKTGATVNHAVVVAGWGTDTTTGLPYWIVRNSWGTGWGLSGYILMRRGVNMCNIEYWPAAVKAV